MTSLLNSSKKVKQTYSIVMFAYNEERNILNSIKSLMENIDQHLANIYIIANGCVDNTIALLNEYQQRKKISALNIIDIKFADKCNAWNQYIHKISLNDESSVHFFIDADVTFTKNAFPMMYSTLIENDNAMAIAGIPFSGRNRKKYQSFIMERQCLFGNCYAVKKAFIHLARQKQFFLPIGLCWIDSAITKAINTDIQDLSDNISNRIIYNRDAGYKFKSLNIFKPNDINIYINRISRYKLGHIQEEFLEKLSISEWPKNLSSINKTINKRINNNEIEINFLLKKRIIKRLQKVTDYG